MRVAAVSSRDGGGPAAGIVHRTGRTGWRRTDEHSSDAELRRFTGLHASGRCGGGQA